MAAKRQPVITGVVPAILTPFRDDLKIDERVLQELADSMASIDGVGAVFCTGHAGEVAALSRAERQHVVRLTAEAVGRRMPVIAGVYTDSVDEAIGMAREAKAAGATAVTLFPPPIFVDGANHSSEMPFRFFEAVAKGAEIPLVIFQFSPAGGLGYSTDTLVRLSTLPEVVAVKEGSGTVPLYEQNVRALAKATPPVPVLTSNNSWLLASLSVGGDGILSGGSNVSAREHVELYRAVQAGDLRKARQVHDRLYPLVQVFYRAPFINMHTRMKEALVMLGRLKRATVRPPLLPIADEEREQIRRALHAAGLL
jgi:4-hydroxy-tetrahydrodipicolinate synthase